MKSVKKVENCTGCGLCESLCPRRAITMQINEDGYLSPYIDDTTCTNCGICLTKCIIANPEQKKQGEQDKPQTYGAWHKNATIQKESSSGGVFSAIAEFILNKGGCVFGVRWISKLHASFVCINSADELAELRGSKYIPAHTNHVYRKILDELKKGRPVLFAGTSCQVYALRTFLKKPYDNLYTMDIVCHGMPSHNAFKKYIEEYETLTRNHIKQIDFRKKIISWQQYSVVRTTTTGAQSHVKYTDDDFMRLFLSDYILNKPCYNCPFITDGRQGDLSIGDFWGIQRYHKEWPLNKGISVVLANSAKGRELLKSQQDSLQVHSVTTSMIERGAVHTIPFRKYPRRPLPGQRSTVLDWLKDPGIPLSKTINRFLGSRPVDAMLMNDKNVGIIGFWYGLNYGAVLTSYALYKQIENLGYQPTLIDCSGFPGIPESNRDEKSVFRKFIRNKALSTTTVFSDKTQMQDLNSIFPTFVVGSDQLWRYDFISDLGHFFFLDFVTPGHKRIAYGTSIGTDPCMAPPHFRARATSLLELFAGVSSREQAGVKVLEKQYNIKAELVLDPVFLPDAKEWSACAEEEANAINTEEYVFCYILDDTKEKKRILNHVLEREKASSVHIHDALKESIRTKSTTNMPTPAEWINGIKNSKHVVTDSFHGLCFAIIFNKPFTVIANRKRGYARFTSLLGCFDLTSYLIESYDDLKRVEGLPGINWEHINARLADMRGKSISWLKEKLDASTSPAQEKAERETLRQHEIQEGLMGHAETSAHNVFLAMNYSRIRRAYFLCYLRGFITFGKKRRKIREKKAELKNLLKRVKKIKRELASLFPI